MSGKDEAPSEPKTPDEQAAFYFARLHGDASAAEREAIRAWIAADPRHAVAYAQVEYAWEMAAGLKAAAHAGGVTDTPDRL